MAIPRRERWARFFTTTVDPPELGDQHDAQTLSRGANRKIARLLKSALANGLLPRSLLLANFVHVLPEDLQIDFHLAALVRVRERVRLLEAIRHHSAHVRKSKISVFRKGMARVNHLAKGLIVMFSQQEVQMSSEHFDSIWTPTLLLESWRIEGTDSFSQWRTERLSSIGTGLFEFYEIPSDSGDSLTETGELNEYLPDHFAVAPEFCSLLGNEAVAAGYARHISPFCLSPAGCIVVCIPALYEAAVPPRDHSGGGFVFVLNKLPTVDVISNLYLIAHKISGSMLEVYDLGRSIIAGEVSRQYGRLLGIFGHHVGNIFKASELLALRTSLERGDVPSIDHLKVVVSNILPVWGLSSAVSLVQKGGPSGASSIPSEWVDPLWLERRDIGSCIQDAVLSILHYIFEHSCSYSPFLPWVVESASEAQEWSWNPNFQDRTSRLASLPPFRDKELLFEKTLTATIGLFEMAINLRKYPNPEGAGVSTRRYLLLIPEEQRRVYVKIILSEGVLRIEFEQPVVLLSDYSLPQSASLEKIRSFERQFFGGLITSQELTRSGDTSVDWIVRAVQCWEFRWSDLLIEHKGAGNEKTSSPVD